MARSIIGAAIEVHRHLGPGYLESVYEQALAAEFVISKMNFERQKPIQIDYKGNAVGEGRLDFLVEQVVIVELKAVERFAPIHRAQVLSYLKATRLHLGLLLNFNEVVMREGIHRVIRMHT